MYIWRKRIPHDWLRPRLEDLTERFGASLAIVERPGKRQPLLQVSCPTANQAHALIREFGGSAEKLRRDWLQHFAKQAQAKPLPIASRLMVLRAPDQERSSRSVRTIVIPAETAFGSGEHATTAMCLRMLERVTRKRPAGWAMLDAGTGTGILAIAGSCLGATRLLAIDNDPIACGIAKRNARVNHIRDIEFQTSDVLQLKLTKKFDVITANLFSELLIKALPRLSRHLVPGGLLILSGILRSQEKAVAAALPRNGFVLQEVRRRGKWLALVASIPRKNS